MRRTQLVAMLALAGVIVPGGSRMAAQTIVRGTLTSELGPVAAGEVVFLKTLEPKRQFRTMSGPTGRFALTLPIAGDYTVIARAIGFLPDTSRLSVVDAEAVLNIQLTSPSFVLSDIVVQLPENSCQSSTVTQAALGRLVDMIRTADELMRSSLDRRDLKFETKWSESRTLNRNGSQKTELISESEGVLSSWPVVAPPMKVLKEYGFGREKIGGEGEGRFWYGLDLGVLWSEWFRASHCFWVEMADDGKAINLRFEPRKSDRIDVEGQLRINSENWSLESLEYRHVHLPPGVPAGSSTGRVEFKSNAEGVWYPATWTLRAPIETPPRYFSRPISSGGLLHTQSRGGIVGFVTKEGRVVRVGPS